MHCNIRRNFYKHFVQGKPDECWPFHNGKDKNGYGHVSANITLTKGQYKSLNCYAHRISYELHKGTIPNRKLICHSCDYPPCVNPAHLFCGTNRDNQVDKVTKDRQLKGELHGGAKLTDSIVQALRNGTLKPSRALARQLGLSDSSHLYRIRNGKYWKHITA